MDYNGEKKQRRERYKGTHPKQFKDKYKELQADKYIADVEKIISQGKTPAGSHRSICVNEILEILKIAPGETGLDATLGYGGHCLEMLFCLNKTGMLYAIDVDPIELTKTRKRIEELGYGNENIIIKKLNFSDIDQISVETEYLNFILADLGVSSMQIDNPERGFSIKHDGPLDLRLNPTTGKSASAFLRTVTQDRLEELLQYNSDEPYAKKIAIAVCSKIAKGLQIETTSQLKQCINEALFFLPSHDRAENCKKAHQRCFQALRIEVNREFEVLEKFLEKIPTVLSSGGRVAIITFHSGEDRLVKKSFQYYLRKGTYKEIADEPVRASVEEINSNPRARSAKIRWAIKA
ncbi:MAG: 16S rRNA (cytosine(1402)-N(4))-methyltransferase RsmH [Saprospiraceae bacterium]|nr:16S rRNA (cytosine(1402)-N(4))-methyltransferase RsmH [Saprospiraceae bacterium]